jgi:hypothetical protein
MSTPITIQLPEEALIEALRQLPPARRRKLLQQVVDPPTVEVVSLPAAALDQWIGLISVGGDALAESEQIYDE